MCPIDPPASFAADTVEALAVVHAWGHAFNERDVDRMLSLSAPDVRLVTGDRVNEGHDAVRRLLHLQSYGVAGHVRPRHYFGRGATVVVETLVEMRWVDGGDLVDTLEAVSVFGVRDGRVHERRTEPDLATAFRTAGWPIQEREALR